MPKKVMHEKKINKINSKLNLVVGITYQQNSGRLSFIAETKATKIRGKAEWNT